MTVGVVVVMFVAAALISTGAFIAVWRRDLTAALTGIPVMFAGAGVAFVGVSRFGTVGGPQLFGHEFAIVLAVAATALVALGLGIAGREASR